MPSSAAAENAGPSAEPEEIVDALPVLEETPQLIRVRRSGRSLAREGRGAAAQMPAVQAAVVAAGGFVAGAAVAGLVHRRGSRTPALNNSGRAARALGRGGTRRRAAAADAVQILGARRFLVDVHVLGTPGSER